MTDDGGREPRHPDSAPHSHEGEAIYEAGAFLGAPADEPIPEREVSLNRRVLNWRTIGSAIFALVLLALTFRTLGVNLGDTVELILAANVGLLVLAFVVYYATFPIRAFRWRYILAKVGTRVKFLDALEILYISWFVNCVVPAKLGDLYRAYLLKAHNGASASRTVGTIFIERIADIIVVFALALAAGYWSFRGRSMPGVDVIFILGFVVAVILIGATIALRFYGQRITRFLPMRFAELWRRFHEGSTGALTRSALPVIGVTTVTIWLLEGARLYFVIHALGIPGVDLGISASVFVALVAALLTAMPLTPAGVGFVEAGIAGALLIYGVSPEHAAAIALTDRAISILSVIITGGIVYLFSGKVRRAHGVGTAPVPSG
jgi:glycosyltransferase 2 family protein